MGEKIDFRKSLKTFYQPSAKDFAMVDVPKMTFIKVDGQGNPNEAPEYVRAVEWLYAVSYGLKFAVREATGRDYVVPPLEGLWWADDMTSFATGAKARWRWTLMIMVPDFATRDLYESAVEKARRKLGEPPASLRLEPYSEGPSLQILHIGRYDEEAPTLRRLHEEVMPARGLVFNGHHHEIYLSDPRKTAPEKLKTVLRQPVRPL